MQYCTTHRSPNGGDRISDPQSALAVVALGLHSPPEDETVVLLLDHDRHGRSIAVVSGTRHADDVIEVVEVLTGAGTDTGRIGALVVASSRPGSGVLPGDDNRWLEMSDISESYGVELLEWFVIGDRVACPRDLLGERPRW